MTDWTPERVRALRDEPPERVVRGAAAAVLVEDHLVYEAVREVMAARDPAEALRAFLAEDPVAGLRLVRLLRDARFAPAVARLAADDVRAGVRTEAVLTMSALAVPERDDVLVAALADPDPSVRARAASGLGRSRTARAVEAVRTAYERETDSTVRVFLVDALIEQGERPARA